MKQRSLNRDTVPKTLFQSCVRSKYINHSYKPRPASLGRRDLVRQTFMKFYKNQRKKDQEVGRELSRLFAEFFSERKFLADRDSTDEESIKYLAKLAEEIKSLKEITRFRDDFPSFASFRRYVIKNEVTLKDLQEL